MANERRMYFGTKRRMIWVRAPQVDYDASRVGWLGGTTQYLDGRAYVRRSTTGHKQYNFTWTNLSRDEIRLIDDYAAGVYGSGPFYFLDPFAVDKNLLPQYWATPHLVLNDAPVLSGQDRNAFIKYPIDLTNSLGYPYSAPQYVWDSTTWPAVALRPTLYIPVPAGYTLWFGAHGVVNSASNSALTVTPDSGTLTQIQILDVNDTNRFSNSWDGGGTMTGVTISLGTIAASQAVIAGMMAQVLPTGVTPAPGGFISGQGNSGVKFADQPQRQDYSAAMDMVSLTAQLVETV